MVKNSGQSNPEGFALGKENLKLMLIGLGIIILGFALMTGGKSTDPNVFNKEIIFSSGFNSRRNTGLGVYLPLHDGSDDREIWESS